MPIPMWAGRGLRHMMVAACVCAAVCAAAQDNFGRTSADESLYLKVKPEHPMKVSALRPGNVVEGSVAQDVYASDRKVLPAGSSIRLTVDKMQRRRRVPNDHWPWVIKLFTPRHELYPTFQSAVGILSGGTEIPLRVSLLSIGPEAGIEPAVKARKSDSGELAKKPARTALGPTITLEASELASEAPSVTALESGTIVAGTQAKIILLDAVSASKNRAGDVVRARLVEPVWAENKIVLPEGTLFEGRVVRSVAPRTLSRAGSLQLEFTKLTLTGGATDSIAASVAGVQVEQRSHMRIDPEGKITGERPGKAWMLINAGVSGGIAKEVDDGTQMVIEAIISSATDASTAGTARIVSTCASTVFMLTRHGRDVVLPKFAQMNIAFDRPVKLETSDATHVNSLP